MFSSSVFVVFFFLFFFTSCLFCFFCEFFCFFVFLFFLLLDLLSVIIYPHFFFYYFINPFPTPVLPLVPPPFFFAPAKNRMAQCPCKLHSRIFFFFFFEKNV